jgi:uncharacterized phage protein (TIGR02218 family)
MTKPISPRLLALLTSTRSDDGNLFAADTYEFTLIGGGTLRYTDGDADLTVNGKLYGAGGVEIGPYFGTSQNEARAHWGLGTNIDTLTFDVIPGSATVLGEPLLKACKDGVFDGATLKLQRLFMPTYGDTRRGPVTIFFGRVAEVDVGRSKATFIVNSFVELLDNPFPRNLYQAGCVNNLGDSACGVNLAALAVAGTVATGSTNGVLLANLGVTPSGQFDQGKLTFTSGLLIGTSRTVKMATAGSPGTITLLYAFPSAPAIGDTFSIFPGCDKTFASSNGCAKFANQARWRGADLIPTAESAI